MIFKSDDPKLKFYRQGKLTRSIEAACEFLNLFPLDNKFTKGHTEAGCLPQSVSDKQFNSVSVWAWTIGDRHGVTGNTVINRAKGILRIYDLTFDSLNDIRRNDLIGDEK